MPTPRHLGIRISWLATGAGPHPAQDVSGSRRIAERLVLSPLTAKTHVPKLFAKLGARDRAQLVVTAYETGLVVANRDHGAADAGTSSRAEPD